jgi:hypothetical protein
MYKLPAALEALEFDYSSSFSRRMIRLVSLRKDQFSREKALRITLRGAAFHAAQPG